MKLCLNMIVKNEAGRIERALKSCVDYIDSYVIVDTGSTDDTLNIIREFFKKHNKKGHVTSDKFVDWSQARNAALIHARNAQERLKWDYLLLMDADMELVVKDKVKFLAHREGPSFDMFQHAGMTHYMNRRLLAAPEKGFYRGVTHEYLDVAAAGLIPEDVAYFIDHADGANRPEKYKRDIRLLLEGLKDEPNNERYFYYLAQSYRDAGQYQDAMFWYRKRVDAGGWAEEQWSAQYNLAHCYKDLGNEAEFIRNMLVAYNMRPTRAETLYDLARYFRDKDGKQATAALFAEIAMGIPRTTDALFVNDYVYEVGCREEFGITAFYVPYKRQQGFEITDRLSQQDGPYGYARHGARINLYWYLPKLEEIAPSFKWRLLDFSSPQGWTAMNPSVTVHEGKLATIVRTVNYRIDEHGRYLIRGTDGTANATNPINTRNYVMGLKEDLSADGIAEEIMVPSTLPCEFPLVVGFEDSRLFSWRGELWTSSTVRQFHHDGNCEQTLAALRRPNIRYAEVQRMLRYPRTTEKNWTPIVQGDDLSFMWRPGVRVDTNGNTIQDTPPKGIATDNLNGGSQLIPFMGGWISLVHSAMHIPGSSCRYYYHRFLYYTAEFKLDHMSQPFVFHDKVIEFAAGMCAHPTQENTYVISYGYRDSEARIATISMHDIARLTWFPYK